MRYYLIYYFFGKHIEKKGSFYSHFEIVKPLKNCFVRLFYYDGIVETEYDDFIIGFFDQIPIIQRENRKKREKQFWNKKNQKFSKYSNKSKFSNYFNKGKSLKNAKYRKYTREETNTYFLRKYKREAIERHVKKLFAKTKNIT